VSDELVVRLHDILAKAPSTLREFQIVEAGEAVAGDSLGSFRQLGCLVGSQSECVRLHVTVVLFLGLLVREEGRRPRLHRVAVDSVVVRKGDGMTRYAGFGDDLGEVRGTHARQPAAV
jgi:hypothetical protein